MANYAGRAGRRSGGRGVGQQPKIVIRRPGQAAHPGQSSKGQQVIVRTIKTRTEFGPGTASSGTHKTD